jgi:hypothetical protein
VTRKTYSSQYRRAATICATLVVVACASYTPQPPTLLRFQSAAVKAEHLGFGVGASPHLDPQRNQEVFQADLKRAGILPLQIVLRNNSPSAITISRQSFRLRYSTGSEQLPASPDEVAARLESSAGVIGWTLAFGLTGFLASSTQQGEVDRARRADLRNKELWDITLKPGDTVQGFLFYLVPANISGDIKATLLVSTVTAPAAQDIRLHLDLPDLGFWPEANGSRSRNGS